MRSPLTPASPQRPRTPLVTGALGEERDLARLLHGGALLAEVALRDERPLRVGDDPVVEALDVHRDGAVDLGAPRRDGLVALEVPVEGLPPELARLLDGLLAVDVVLVHENADEVVRLRWSPVSMWNKSGARYY